MDISIQYTLILSVLFSVVISFPVEINLTHNGPVVLGANITFTAELIDYINQAPSGTFEYEWSDNAFPPHSLSIFGSTSPTVQWNVSYPASKYKAKEYTVTLKAYIKEFIYIPLAHQSVKFNVTDTLNGEMDVEQGTRKEINLFVASSSPVKHTIQLFKPDLDFLTKNATQILTFWFVDCLYYGFTTDLSFTFNYTEEKSYSVEALVVASYDELPPVVTTTIAPISTTTTISTSTTTTTTAHPTPKSTTSAPNNYNFTHPTSPSTVDTSSSPNDKSNLSSNFVEMNSVLNETSHTNRFSRSSEPEDEGTSVNDVESTTDETSPTTVGYLPSDLGSIAPILSKLISDQEVFFQKRLAYDNMPVNLTSIAPYACLNSTFVPHDPNKTYGYFSKNITVKAPISKVVINGNNWINFGDVLNLNVTCNGSGKFQHCSKIKVGYYNITGNETCSSPLEADSCDFSLFHYFREVNTYTYIIVITNDVSKVVMPAVIRMYKVTVQPQLSVIVVPVTCSLLAIIIIVFGVAYYVQSQNRYTVEVADFDFGQANDMEYKSFYERLREDISNMFSRSGDFANQPGALPRRNNYDSMEES